MLFGIIFIKEFLLESIDHQLVKELQKKVYGLDLRCQQLEEENRSLKFQLQEYREKFFKKKKRSEDSDEEQKPPAKRGAPIGHPGVTRAKPDRVDEQIDVKLQKCPECGSTDLKKLREVEDHDQEDIILPQVKVTRYRHHLYECRCCKEKVQGVGPGELPGSYIGPVAKSLAAYLHYQIKVPYRKIAKLFEQDRKSVV